MAYEVSHHSENGGISRVSKKECIYVGDSETDIEAFQEVGLAIAFNPQSEELEKVADQVVKSKSLADVLRDLPGGIAVLL